MTWPEMNARQAAVDVWYWRTDTVPADLGAWSQLIERHGLTREEQSRASRLIGPAKQLSFLASRAGLRAILSQYAGRAPGDLVFDIGAHGKPSLAGGPQFNLSHSGTFAALAVSDGPALGIDIELPRPVSRSLPGRFFSPIEAELLDGLDGETWDAAFFRCWTRKEAVAKALGTGLSRDPRSFTVAVGPEPPFTVRGVESTAAEDGAWQLLALEPPAVGYVAALALKSPAAVRVGYRIWRPEIDGWPSH